MKLSVIKLGTPCSDKATGLSGAITHWTCDMSKQVHYLFQPKGIGPEGQPIQCLYLEKDRFSNLKPLDFEEIEIPLEILGTEVKDKVTGIKGMAVSFLRHVHGCFHVYIQPKGKPNATSVIQKNDFDLRGCEGPAIKKLSKKEIKKSQNEEPSPSSRIITNNLVIRKNH